MRRKVELDSRSLDSQAEQQTLSNLVADVPINCTLCDHSVGLSVSQLLSNLACVLAFSQFSLLFLSSHLERFTHLFSNDSVQQPKIIDLILLTPSSTNIPSSSVEMTSSLLQVPFP